MDRLAEHAQHPGIINRIRDLRVPLIQGKKHKRTKHHNYDARLAETIGLFNRALTSVQLVFEDWDSSGNTHVLEDMENTLASDRHIPICFRAIDAINTFMPNITNLAFEGIRSGEDHGLVLSVLRRASHVKHLSISYRMDWAVLTVIRNVGDNVESRNLWRLMGDMEQLETLRLSCLPARDVKTSEDWTPDVWQPRLKRLDLCRVPMSRGLLHTMITRAPELLSLALDEYSAQFLPMLPAVASSSLRYFTLAGINIALCQQAMKPFLSAHIVRLDLSLSEVSESMMFLNQYGREPIGFAGLHAIVLNLHNDTNEGITNIVVAQNRALFAAQGIELEVRRPHLD